MTNYEKPVVLANEDVAEGVYAASGAVVPEASAPAEIGGGSGSASVTGVELTSAGNEYYKVNTYNVTITNNGNEDKADWSVTVSVTSGTASGAQIYNSWLASASLNGSTITITPGGGGAIGAGQSIVVEVVVSYSSDAIIVE